MEAQNSTFFLLLLLADAVVAMSLLRYLAVGWCARRADVMGGQTPEACLEYFKMFSRDGAYKRKSSMTPLTNIRGSVGMKQSP